MTSRHHVLDQIELIGNQIALVSHLQELVFSIENDIKYNTTSEDKDKQEITMILNIIKSTTTQRRIAMKQLGDGDKNYRCALKHCIATYQFSTEVFQATNNPVDWTILKESYENMIIVLSKYLGLEEVVLCWRCLSDKLLGDG